MPSATFRLPVAQADELRRWAGAHLVSQSHVVRDALDVAFKQWGLPTADGKEAVTADGLPYGGTATPRLVRLPVQVRRLAAHPEEADHAERWEAPSGGFDLGPADD